MQWPWNHLLELAATVLAVAAGGAATACGAGTSGGVAPVGAAATSSTAAAIAQTDTRASASAGTPAGPATSSAPARPPWKPGDPWHVDVVITPADASRTVRIAPGDIVQVDTSRGPYVISVDWPDVLAPIPIPTPSGELFFATTHAGPGQLVVRGHCAAPSQCSGDVFYALDVVVG